MKQHALIQDHAMATLNLLEVDNAEGIVVLSFDTQSTKKSTHENAYLQYANVQRDNHAHRLKIIQYVRNAIAKRQLTRT